jgi:hypothetical protein
VAIRAGAVGEGTERPADWVLDPIGILDEEGRGQAAVARVGRIAPEVPARAGDHESSDARIDRGQASRDEGTHRVADHVDQLEVDLVEYRLRVTDHGVVGVRLRVMRSVGSAVAASVSRDRRPTGGNQRVDDPGIHPVVRVIGREAVQQQHGASIARGSWIRLVRRELDTVE